MSRFNLYIIAGVMLLLMACSPQSPKINEANLENEIKQTLDAHVDAINSSGFASAAELYSRAENFTWIEDGRLQYESREDIETAFDQIANASSQLVIDINEIDILDSDNAYIAYEFKQNLVFPDGPAFSFSGVITAVMAKEDGQWRIVHGHTSTPKQRN